MFKSLSLPAILQFSKFVIDDIEPFLQFFLPEDLLAVFLHHRLKTLILNIMTCFIRPEVLETKSSVKKLMRIYPSNHKNILSCDGINVAFVARKVPPPSTWKMEHLCLSVADSRNFLNVQMNVGEFYQKPLIEQK